MKSRKDRKIARILMILAVITFISGLGVSAAAADHPGKKPVGAYIFNKDPFDAAYSAGYFQLTGSNDQKGCDILKPSTNCNASYLIGDGGNMWVSGSNTSKENAVAIAHKNGASMDGKNYDVKEYVWQSNCTAWMIRVKDGASHADWSAEKDKKPNKIFREFHFYPAGTFESMKRADYLKDNFTGIKEVTFRGILQLTDIDIDEGYTFMKGLKGVWLNELTNVEKKSSPANTWLGTWENKNDNVQWDRETMWAQVVSTPSSPLTIAYWGNARHTSGINYYSNSTTNTQVQVKYEVVASNGESLPAGANNAENKPSTVKIAKNSKYNVQAQTKTFNDYEFDGWYTDSKLTKKASAQITVSANTTLYGTYRHLDVSVTTAAEHGTITASDTSVPYGSDKKITYSPEKGYLLKSVTVDGKPVDITKYPSGYTFTKTQANHTIKAVYVKPTAAKNVYKKGNLSEDIDGQILKEGDVVTYRISCTNPTGADRTVEIFDPVPDGMTVIDDSISQGGSLSGGTVVWRLNVAAGSSESVAFDCRIKDDTDPELKNTAEVLFRALEENGSEKDISLTGTASVLLLSNPEKFVMNADGKEITASIVNSGSIVTYRIAFENPADEPKVFTVVDPLPQTLAYVDGSISDGGKVVTEEKKTKAVWELTLDAGEKKTVTFGAKIKEPDTKLTKVSNQAEVTADGTIKTTISVHKTPDVSLYILDLPKKTVFDEEGKNISEDTRGKAVQTVKRSGDRLTYRISFSNPADTPRDFTVTDTLPENVNYISSDQEGSYKKADRTITWKLRLAPGEEASVAVTVQIEKASEGTIIKNAATVTADEAEVTTNEVETPILENPGKVILNKAGKIISKDENGNELRTVKQSGDTITYRISFSNPSDTDKIFTVTDVLPEGTEYLSSDHNGTYNPESRTVLWKVPVKAKVAADVSINVRILKEAEGRKLRNKAAVAADGSELITNTTETPVLSAPQKTVLNSEGLDIGRDKDGKTIQTVKKAGDILKYKIMFANPADTPCDFTITDTLPENVKYLSSDHNGNYQEEDRKTTWQLKLVGKEKTSVTVTVQVRKEAEGTVIKNSAAVSTDEAKVTTNETETPILTAPKKDILNDKGEVISEDREGAERHTIKQSGDAITYRVSFSNPAEAKKTFTIMNTLPEGVEYLSSDHDGAYDPEARTVRWHIPAEAKADINVSVNVRILKEAEGRRLINRTAAEVDGAELFTNLVETPVLAVPEKTVFNSEGLDIGKDKDGNAMQTVKKAGDLLTYRITFANPAEEERSFSITDILPEGLEYISSTGGGSYDESHHMTVWNVPLSAESSGYVEMVVKVRDDAKGSILKNSAMVSSDEAEIATNFVETPIMPEPLKDVVSGGKSIDNMMVAADGSFEYKICTANPSDTEKTALITDALPEGVEYISADHDGTYDKEQHIVTWSTDIAAHSAETVSVKVKVLESAIKKELNNQASVSMDEAVLKTITGCGKEKTSNYVTAKEVLKDGEDVNNSSIHSEDRLTYRIYYKNTGLTRKTIDITDVLPAGTEFVSASGGGITEPGEPQKVVWSLMTEPEEEGFAEVEVKVLKSAMGNTLKNRAEITEFDQENSFRTIATNETENDVIVDSRPEEVKKVKNDKTAARPEKKQKIQAADTSDRSISDMVFRMLAGWSLIAVLFCKRKEGMANERDQ